jgi:hypothetical protein
MIGKFIQDLISKLKRKPEKPCYECYRCHLIYFTRYGKGPFSGKTEGVWWCYPANRAVNELDECPEGRKFFRVCR